MSDDTPPTLTHDPAPPDPPPTAPYYADEADDELPPRPSTRLLTPWTVLLGLLLFAACGFVGGVLVEKGQVSSSNSLGSLASALAGRGATGQTGTTGGGGGFAGLFGGGAGSRGTIGTVANISGNKIYVTTTAGDTVEVVVPTVAKVTKSQSVGRKSIRPGDSVVVTGITASNGKVTASAITDSGTGSSGGGIASLFGGGAPTGSSSSSSSGSGVSLFGGG